VPRGIHPLRRGSASRVMLALSVVVVRRLGSRTSCSRATGSRRLKGSAPLKRGPDPSALEHRRERIGSWRFESAAARAPQRAPLRWPTASRSRNGKRRSLAARNRLEKKPLARLLGSAPGAAAASAYRSPRARVSSSTGARGRSCSGLCDRCLGLIVGVFVHGRHSDHLQSCRVVAPRPSGLRRVASG